MDETAVRSRGAAHRTQPWTSAAALHGWARLIMEGLIWEPAAPRVFTPAVVESDEEEESEDETH